MFIGIYCRVDLKMYETLESLSIKKSFESFAKFYCFFMSFFINAILYISLSIKLVFWCTLDTQSMQKLQFC